MSCSSRPAQVDAGKKPIIWLPTDSITYEFTYKEHHPQSGFLDVWNRIINHSADTVWFLTWSCNRYQNEVLPDTAQSSVFLPIECWVNFLLQDTLLPADTILFKSSVFIKDTSQPLRLSYRFEHVPKDVQPTSYIADTMQDLAPVLKGVFKP